MCIGGEEVGRNPGLEDNISTDVQLLEVGGGRWVCTEVCVCVEVCAWKCVYLLGYLCMVLKTTDHPELNRKNRLYGKTKSKA